MKEVTTDDLILAHKYDESERNTIEMFRLGAVAFLENASMYHIGNELTNVVVILMVGFWMDNRESNYTDFKNIRDFPIGMQGLLNQLRYSAGVATDGQA